MTSRPAGCWLAGSLTCYSKQRQFGAASPARRAAARDAEALMAEERYSKEKLIVLRRLTRAIAELLRDQIRDYLSVLAPLLRPAVVLGGYVQGSSKAPSVAAEKAFQELQSLYAAVARAKPYGLVPELKPPLQIATTNLDLTPVEHTYKAKAIAFPRT